MLSHNAANNRSFQLLTVYVLPPLPLPSLPLHLPLTRPPRPQTNLSRLPLTMVGFWDLVMNLLSEER